MAASKAGEHGWRIDAAKAGYFAARSRMSWAARDAGALHRLGMRGRLARRALCSFGVLDQIGWAFVACEGEGVQRHCCLLQRRPVIA